MYEIIGFVIFSISFIILFRYLSASTKEISFFRGLKRCKRCFNKNHKYISKVGGWKIYSCKECGLFQWKCGDAHWFANDYEENQNAIQFILERRVDNK